MSSLPLQLMPPHAPVRRRLIRRLSFVIGPGILVMLADTDVGSIITAAQSGAVWGYRLLLLQFLLIPVLYIVQELTLRLGLVTGQGHGELIRNRFGRGWAWFSVTTLLVSCFGGIVTQMTGMAGIAQLFGLPVWLMMALVVSGIMLMVWTGSYRRVERIALVFGLFELVFILLAYHAGPEQRDITANILAIPWHNKDYLYLVAGNIGAVIMPWMIFYQQSAVIDKRLTRQDLTLARIDTAIGAGATQLIMAAVLMAMAAAAASGKLAGKLDNLPDLAAAMERILGSTNGRIVFAAGISGAALVATVVISLTAAWGVGEVAGYRRSLEDHPREAPWFYGIFSFCLIIGGVIVASGVNLVNLSVAVEVMNALLLPIVVGFLYLLALKTLPDPYRLKGIYAIVVGAILALTAGFGFYAGMTGVFSGA